ncbi:MAG TPA: DUF167 domain-containing protein [Trebonia sp.]|nr:DUF167 domain-containing protein [Trebonia sp.]
MTGPQGDEELRVTVRVKPGASRTTVGGRHGDRLVVAVTAKPVDGKATEAALRAVAEAFGVSRSSVTLVTGATSRDKVIGIAGPGQALASRLDELLRR